MKKGEIPVTPLHAAPAEVSLSLCTHVRGSDTACAGTRHQRSDSEAPEQKRTWQSTRDSNSAGSTRDRYLHGATLIRVGKKKNHGADKAGAKVPAAALPDLGTPPRSPTPAPPAAAAPLREAPGDGAAAARRYPRLAAPRRGTAAPRAAPLRARPAP